MSGVFARNGTNDIFDFSILGTNYSQIWHREMHSCSFKSSYGLSSMRKNSSFACLSNFYELFSREESACIFWILKNKNAFPTPREKKFVKIAQTSKRRVFAYARQPIRAFEWARMHFPRLDLAVSRPPNRKLKNVTCAISCESPAHIRMQRTPIFFIMMSWVII